MTLTITARRDAQVVAIRQLSSTAAPTMGSWCGEWPRRRHHCPAGLATSRRRRYVASSMRGKGCWPSISTPERREAQADCPRSRTSGLSIAACPRVGSRSCPGESSPRRYLELPGSLVGRRKSSPGCRRLASAWLIKRFIDRGARVRHRSSGRANGRRVQLDCRASRSTVTHVGEGAPLEVLSRSVRY